MDSLDAKVRAGVAALRRRHMPSATHTDWPVFAQPRSQAGLSQPGERWLHPPLASLPHSCASPYPPQPADLGPLAQCGRGAWGKGSFLSSPRNPSCANSPLPCRCEKPCLITPLPFCLGPGTRNVGGTLPAPSLPSLWGRCAWPLVLLWAQRILGPSAGSRPHLRPRRPVQRRLFLLALSRDRGTVLQEAPGPCLVRAQQVSPCTSQRLVHPLRPGWKHRTVFLGPVPCFVLPHIPTWCSGQAIVCSPPAVLRKEVINSFTLRCE